MGAEREAMLDMLAPAGASVRVRALLETDEMIFRAGPSSKKFATLVVKFSDIANLVAKDGALIFTTKNKKKHALHLGEPFASRWLEKIKNPKGLFEKLGIKSGSCVALLGDEEGSVADFASELRARSDVSVVAVKQADLYLLLIKSKADLAALPALAKTAAKTGAGLWIVYPKGKPDPRELDVISAGRDAGLKDVKVARFSETHTALKFVAPKT